MIVPDNETKVDLLYYEAIARTVVRLVIEKSDQPLSIGVHGDWGAGKSSVLMMVEDTLATDVNILCVRFNGWLFQGFEDAKTVLIESIVKELMRQHSTSKKVVDQAKKVLRRVDWMKIARKVLQYGVSFTTGIPLVETVRDLSAAAHNVMSTLGDGQSSENLASLIESSGIFLNEMEEHSAPEHMHAFREEFEELLNKADITRLVVLVDDLDRCLPNIAIDTLEAIRLFLFVPQAAFVIAADEGMIEYAVRQHFPDLPDRTGPATYARNYLEKLIQVPFRLPSLGHTETRIYVTLLLVLNDFGDKSEEFTKMVDIAREALRTPWTKFGFERKAIEEELNSVPPKIDRALELGGCIAPILVEGARGNPRQIKRFINTMMLRLAIAEERGFRDSLNVSVLAKIMLVEQFAPELYDAIARGSARTGKTDELKALEAIVQQKTSVKSSSKSKTGKSKEQDDENSLPDWPNIEWAKQWAAIEPQLAEIDLRPYFFVTRDRRSVYGSVTSLGELDDLVTKLLGSSLQVKQVASDIERLETIEAERMFEILRKKIRDCEDLLEEPAGARGLAELARHHPILRSSLLSFLADLPISKLGPWIVTGWSGLFDDAKLESEFAQLIEGWKQQDQNDKLSAAANAVTKLTKSKGDH